MCHTISPQYPLIIANTGSTMSTPAVDVHIRRCVLSHFAGGARTIIKRWCTVRYCCVAIGYCDIRQR